MVAFINNSVNRIYPIVTSVNAFVHQQALAVSDNAAAAAAAIKEFITFSIDTYPIITGCLILSCGVVGLSNGSAFFTVVALGGFAFLLQRGQEFEQEGQTLEQETQVLKQQTQVLKQQTQVLKQQTQVLEQQTQVLKQETQVLEQETQVLEQETQVLEQETQVLEQETQVLQQETQVLE